MKSSSNSKKRILFIPIIWMIRLWFPSNSWFLATAFPPLLLIYRGIMVSTFLPPSYLRTNQFSSLTFVCRSLLTEVLSSYYAFSEREFLSISVIGHSLSQSNLQLVKKPFYSVLACPLKSESEEQTFFSAILSLPLSFALSLRFSFTPPRSTLMELRSVLFDSKSRFWSGAMTEIPFALHERYRFDLLPKKYPFSLNESQAIGLYSLFHSRISCDAGFSRKDSLDLDSLVILSTSLGFILKETSQRIIHSISSQLSATSEIPQWTEIFADLRLETSRLSLRKAHSFSTRKNVVRLCWSLNSLFSLRTKMKIRWRRKKERVTPDLQ